MSVEGEAGVLLAAARMQRKRFNGRAALDRAAGAGDLHAIEALCRETGVALPGGPGWADRTVLARATAPVDWGDATVDERRAVIDFVRAGLFVDGRAALVRAAADVRRLRAWRIAHRRAPAPPPGRISAMQAARRERDECSRIRLLIMQAVNDACILTTTHGHKTRVALCDPGDEYAESSVGTVRPSALGLSNAYARKAFWVHCSTHVWHAPWGAEPYARDGYVYLSDTVRVRNGRGASLVTERLAAGRNGRLTWRTL